jgi:diazepam-binding inhibitor (GABA receptor modulating acyl-CoA-binding protein)
MVDIGQKFNDAVEQSKQLTQRPSDQELLQLYALYKQGTEGNVTGERPGGFDFKGIAKYNAWADLHGMSKEDAQDKYVGLVDDLKARYS